jgi:SAM-dependent methyltransferase
MSDSCVRLRRGDEEKATPTNASETEHRTHRFALEVKTFENPWYGHAFERFRRMSDSTFEQYFACLRLPSLSTGHMIDVGAGPGLQTEMLLARVPAGWSAVALEPSAGLRALARTRLRNFGRRASFLGCRFEQISNCGVYDVVWMSEVVHLLGDVSGWTDRLAEVMKPGGRVLVRTSTHTQLRNRKWYRYFPGLLEIDLARHPTKTSVVRGLANAGFARVAAATVDESRWISCKSLLTMIDERAFSTLHYLSSADLHRGRERLRADLRSQSRTKWHYEMTAYTATAP